MDVGDIRTGRGFVMILHQVMEARSVVRNFSKLMREAALNVLKVFTFYTFVFTLAGLGGYRCEGAREVLQIIGYPAFLVERDFYSYKTISPQFLYLKYIM